MIEAFLLGILGSFHCLGMCGPIALALPSSRSNNQFYIALQYSAGRLLSYSLLGLVFGIFGKGINISGFQQWVSIFAGALLILSIVVPSLLNIKSTLIKPLNFFYSRVKSSLSSLLKSESMFGVLGIGFLNGFLPCGLVYIALIGSILSHTIIDSVMYMFFFGLGTSPALTLLILSSNLITNKVKQRISKIIPSFIVVLGILFVLRGLGIGIPYISPKVDVLKPVPTVESCH